MGALRSAMAAKIADGKLTVVDSSRFPRPRPSSIRQALNKLEAGKTTLWSRPARSSTRSFILGSRNLEGVELVLSSEVHPYDLLRYEHAVFSKDAIEALQETLKKYVSKRASRFREGGRVMPTLYTVIRRPLITEKGMGVKETQNTLVFEVAPEGHQDRSQAGSRSPLQGQGRRSSHRELLKARSAAAVSSPATAPTGRRLTFA